MCLRREDDSIPLAGYLSGRERRHTLHELGDRPGDAKTIAVDGPHVIGHGIDERDVMAGAREEGTHRPADGTRAPYEKSHSPHVPSRRARVSSTATCQSASMSSSGR